ncbi:3-oxoacyl-[acyl-carrier-protein] synthase [Aphanomyces cochlioides]|nr:3-oxoacyl-[acyl-carrier-protein] synthase [Aphanomyces cochlioides]
MVSLIDAARSHVQKICQAGDDCVAVLASPSRYDVNKLIHIFDTVRGDDVRLLIMSQLEFIVKSWSQADLDPYVEGTRNVLAKGLHDKSEPVRVKARDILSLLRDTRYKYLLWICVTSPLGSRCDILFITKDRDPIYYENESENPSAVDFAHAQAALAAAEAATEEVPEEAEMTPAPVVAPVEVAPVVVVAPVVAAPPAAAPAAAVTDEPVSVNHVLRVFLAHRFKKQLSEIDDNVTIHGLAAGKSAAQNEVVGELEKEFGGGVDRVPELPVSILATSFKSYKQFSPVFTTLTTDFVRKQLPGGFNISQVKSYLSSEFGLGAGRTDSVLMHSLLFPRVVRLADKTVVAILGDKAWFTLAANQTLAAGASYKFDLKSSCVYADGHSTLASFDIQGSVYGGPNFDHLVGAVAINATGVPKDPVASYLDRVAPIATEGAKTQCNLLATPVTIEIPVFDGEYVRASRDLNPIHRCAYSAAFANLPNGQPIMLGMWTATKVRNLMMDVMRDPVYSFQSSRQV